MGDAADDAIDRIIDEMLIDEWDDEGYYSVRVKTCRRCGATGLSWGLEKGKWMLHEADGKIHVCDPKKVFK